MAALWDSKFNLHHLTFFLPLKTFEVILLDVGIIMTTGVVVLFLNYSQMLQPHDIHSKNTTACFFLCHHQPQSP